jgi:hypothetical protein
MKIDEYAAEQVSAKLQPVYPHSVEELRDLLAPVAREVHILSSGWLAYEGAEEPLQSVENIAYIHILPYQGFDNPYF